MITYLFVLIFNYISSKVISLSFRKRRWSYWQAIFIRFIFPMQHSYLNFVYYSFYFVLFIISMLWTFKFRIEWEIQYLLALHVLNIMSRNVILSWIGLYYTKEITIFGRDPLKLPNQPIKLFLFNTSHYFGPCLETWPNKIP